MTARRRHSEPLQVPGIAELEHAYRRVVPPQACLPTADDATVGRCFENRPNPLPHDRQGGQ